MAVANATAGATDILVAHNGTGIANCSARGGKACVRVFAAAAFRSPLRLEMTTPRSGTSKLLASDCGAFATAGSGVRVATAVGHVFARQLAHKEANSDDPPVERTTVKTSSGVLRVGSIHECDFHVACGATVVI